MSDPVCVSFPLRVCVCVHIKRISVIHASHSPDTHMADITWTSASCISRPFLHAKCLAVSLLQGAGGAVCSKPISFHFSICTQTLQKSEVQIWPANVVINLDVHTDLITCILQCCLRCLIENWYLNICAMCRWCHMLCWELSGLIALILRCSCILYDVDYTEESQRLSAVYCCMSHESAAKSHSDRVRGYLQLNVKRRFDDMMCI